MDSGAGLFEDLHSLDDILKKTFDFAGQQHLNEIDCLYSTLVQHMLDVTHVTHCSWFNIIFKKIGLPVPPTYISYYTFVVWLFWFLMNTYTTYARREMI